MKLLTALQALILIGLMVYGAGAVEMPQKALDCSPVQSTCLRLDVARTAG